MHPSQMETLERNIAEGAAFAIQQAEEHPNAVHKSISPFGIAIQFSPAFPLDDGRELTQLSVGVTDEQNSPDGRVVRVAFEDAPQVTEPIGLDETYTGWIRKHLPGFHGLKTFRIIEYADRERLPR